MNGRRTTPTERRQAPRSRIRLARLTAQRSGEICRRVVESAVASVLTEQLSDTAGRRRSAHTAAQTRKLARQQRLRMYRFADAAMLLAASVVAVIAAAGAESVANFAWGAAYALLALAILESRGFYDVRIHDSPLDTTARIFAATSIGAMVLTFARALVTDDPLLAEQTLRLWAFALVFLGAGRLGITLDRRRALRRGETGFNALIVGAGTIGHADRQAPARAPGARPAADRLPRQGPDDRATPRTTRCRCSAPAGTSRTSCSDYEVEQVDRHLLDRTARRAAEHDPPLPRSSASRSCSCRACSRRSTTASRSSTSAGSRCCAPRPSTRRAGSSRSSTRSTASSRPPCSC